MSVLKDFVLKDTEVSTMFAHTCYVLILGILIEEAIHDVCVTVYRVATVNYLIQELRYVFQACFVGDIPELLFQQIPRFVLIEMLEKQYAKEHILWLVFFTIVNHTAQQVLTHTVKTTIHVGELKVPQYVVIRPWSLFPIVLSPKDIHSLAHPI